MMVPLSLASLLSGVSSSTKGTTRYEKGEEMGEERKNPQKTHRSQFWYDVSYDQTLFCETYFALTIFCASCVLYRGICLRYITLALFLTLPCCCGVRNTLYATKRKPEMYVLAKRCKEIHGRPRKKRVTMVF